MHEGTSRLEFWNLGIRARRLRMMRCGGSMKNRVRIGTCSGPAEAAFVRSVFDAHELPVIINGEMHASAMGGLAGFVQLDIFVAEDAAEEAAALLHDIRAGEHAVADGDDAPDGEAAAAAPDAGDRGDPCDPDSDERADAEGVWLSSQAPRPPVTAGAFTPTTGFDSRPRRTGAVLLLSVLLGFGSAHMSTGAWGRGIAIAALNVLGFLYVAQGDFRLGGWMLFGARFVDLLGALWRVWSQPADGGQMQRRGAGGRAAL